MQIPAGTCMYLGRCRYLPRMRVPVARVGSSVAWMLPQMTGMDFWPWVPVLADADVSGYAIVKISNAFHSSGLESDKKSEGVSRFLVCVTIYLFFLSKPLLSYLIFGAYLILSLGSATPRSLHIDT